MFNKVAHHVLQMVNNFLRTISSATISRKNLLLISTLACTPLALTSSKIGAPQRNAPPTMPIKESISTSLIPSQGNGWGSYSYRSRTRCGPDRFVVITGNSIAIASTTGRSHPSLREGRTNASTTLYNLGGSTWGTCPSIT